LGKGDVDWEGQIAALCADGYSGWISLETHWPGPGGDKHEASRICGRNLKTLAARRRSVRDSAGDSINPKGRPGGLPHL